MRHLIFLALLTAFGSGPVIAGEVREIEMKDGTKLTAEVLSFSNGVYTVRSDSLGTLTLEESKVLAIRTKSTQPAGQSALAGAGSLQERMLGDKEVMDRILTLQDDPEFQKVLEDPALMQAINSGDLPTLMANPRFMKLLNNSTVKDIQTKIK